MPMLITDEGWSVINAAGLTGPRVNLTQFKVMELDPANYAAYTPATTDTEAYLTGTLGAVIHHTGTVRDYDIVSATEIKFTCSMDAAVGTFNYNVLVMYHEDPSVPGVFTMFGVYKMPTTVPKTASSGGLLGDTQDLIARFQEGQLVGTINYNITNAKYTYNFIPEVNDLGDLPEAQTTGSRMYRLTRDEGVAGSGVNTYLVHAAKVAYDLQGYQNNEWIPESHSLVWNANALKQIDAGGAGLLTSASSIVIAVPETSPLESAKIPSPYNGLVISFFQTGDANQGYIRNVTAVTTATDSGTEYIRFTLSEPLPNAPTVGAKIKVWSPSGVGSTVGGGGGTTMIGNNYFVEATAIDEAGGYQYTINTSPCRAANSILFAAPGYIPESKYNVTGTYTIELSAGNGLPVGTKYQVVERSVYLIPGGTTGQVLTKLSNNDGDYAWGAASRSMPPGVQLIWPGHTVPNWALERNGATLNRSTYTDLFEILCPTFTSSPMATPYANWPISGTQYWCTAPAEILDMIEPGVTQIEAASIAGGVATILAVVYNPGDGIIGLRLSTPTTVGSGEQMRIFPFGWSSSSTFKLPDSRGCVDRARGTNSATRVKTDEIEVFYDTTINSPDVIIYANGGEDLGSVCVGAIVTGDGIPAGTVIRAMYKDIGGTLLRVKLSANAVSTVTGKNCVIYKRRLSSYQGDITPRHRHFTVGSSNSQSSLNSSTYISGASSSGNYYYEYVLYGTPSYATRGRTSDTGTGVENKVKNIAGIPIIVY